MMEYKGLFCAASGAGFDLDWRDMGARARLRSQDVVVKVHATSVNPIDVKRAAGYGARVLRLKGAAGMPRVLGNDFVGEVCAWGSQVSGFTAGQRVWGVLDTGPIGAHATLVGVPARQLLLAPPGVPDPVLAALPYTFCTLWRALQGVGMDAGNAKGRRVLVHGASGGLGLLALQVLQRWGAFTTAVCSTPAVGACLSAGASEAFDRTAHSLHELPATYDAVLNFATWADEGLLAGKLNARALGMASTTHPLLGALDQQGWLRGMLHIVHEQNAMRRLVRQRNPGATYRWTVFRPDTQALQVLAELARDNGLGLPIGVVCPVTDAQPAFAHVARQARGRAVLTLTP